MRYPRVPLISADRRGREDIVMERDMIFKSENLPNNIKYQPSLVDLIICAPRLIGSENHPLLRASASVRPKRHGIWEMILYENDFSLSDRKSQLRWRGSFQVKDLIRRASAARQKVVNGGSMPQQRQRGSSNGGRHRRLARLYTRTYTASALSSPHRHSYSRDLLHLLFLLFIPRPCPAMHRSSYVHPPFIPRSTSLYSRVSYGLYMLLYCRIIRAFRRSNTTAESRDLYLWDCNPHFDIMLLSVAGKRIVRNARCRLRGLNEIVYHRLLTRERISWSILNNISILFV